MGMAREHQTDIGRQRRKRVGAVAEQHPRPWQGTHRRIGLVVLIVAGPLVVEPAERERTDLQRLVGEHAHADPGQGVAHLAAVAPVIVIAEHRDRAEP